MAYTYDDFMKALREQGQGLNFSQYDLDLAAKNPGAGMQLLQYKLDYNASTDPTIRAAANAAANAVRSQYGSYTGGADGSEYNALAQSGLTSDLLNQMINYGSYSGSGAAPTYTNQYKRQIDELLNNILKYREGGFDYTPSEDSNWTNYKKAYLREGDRAQANALAGAAALTGGLPSSYASTAASQAGDYYASKLTDKLPELYQQAYNRYLDEYNMKLSDLSATQGVEQGEYNKFLTELGQFNADRNFDYGAWLDQFNMLSTNFGASNTLDQQNVALTADEFKRQMQMAELAAAYGDLSGLQGLGIDTSAYVAAQRAGGGGSSGTTQDTLATKANLYFDNYSQAVEYMKSNNVKGTVAAGVMTENEWRRRKQAGAGVAAMYNSYAEYLSAFVEWAIANPNGDLRNVAGYAGALAPVLTTDGGGIVW